MGLVDLFCVASMPVLKVLLITALGSFLALDNIDILGENARKHVNQIVFFVFNPALVGTNLAKTITFSSMKLLWFMPLNILVTVLIGSALGWILIKFTRAPQHLKGLVLGSCAAGNLGNLPIIIIPAICREKGSPFGEPDICHTYAMAYASLSMAIGAIFLWSYVYNMVRVSSSNIGKEVNTDESKSNCVTPEKLQGSYEEPLLPPEDHSSMESVYQFTLPQSNSDVKGKVPMSDKIKLHLMNFSRNLNLKAIFAPSTTATIIGFIIGTIPLVRKLFIGSTAPFRVVQDSAALIGDAAIPTVTLIVGGNLLKGLKVSGVQPLLVVGIIAVRYIFLPLVGIIVVKGAIHFGLVHPDPLYQFVLLLQYAVPPAMNIGTITQLFGAGQSECSVILLWTYALASVALTFWSTFFLWLVA
ncbi:protein PIN-LIKES 3-like [Diospyros lotus]|uniref:protein PIN-LIKES 3-like n=1 Tax=Diospyros lotus TaxID=55363 RepID=UPI00224F4EC4|nr:protein PIN-LIKES 3-like [Diospyros lotus]